MKKFILSLGLLVSSVKIVAAEQPGLKPKIAFVVDSVVEGVTVGLVMHGAVGRFFGSRYSLPLTCVGATGISLGGKIARGTFSGDNLAETVKSTVKTVLAGGFTAGGAYLVGFRDPMYLAQIGAAGALAWRGVKSVEKSVPILQNSELVKSE